MIRNVVMREPGLYYVLGLVRIQTFGPYIWATEDLDGSGANGAIFRCYEDGNEQELAYLLAADVTGDPSEPEIEALRREDVEAVDRYLEEGIRRALPNAGRKMIRWMSSSFHETELGNRLMSPYIAEDQGRQRQYIDYRMLVSGRKWVVSGCFDVARASDFARPILDAVRGVGIHVGSRH